MKVTITTRKVGQAFGVYGVVSARNGLTLHVTEVKPYGCTPAAFNAAVSWADAHGHDHGYVWVEGDYQGRWVTPQEQA